MHGGQSRLLDGTLWRSLVLRGDQSRLAILAGFKEFSTDYYHYSASLSTIFRNAGFDEVALHTLGHPPQIDNLLMSFCPAFREWVHRFAGEKAMEFFIEWYGLYGDPRLPLETLEDNLGLNDAEAFRTWAFGKLHDQGARDALEQIAVNTGMNTLQKARD